MNYTGPKRTKLRGIVRTELSRIEEMLRGGYTITGVVELLEHETGLKINHLTFKTALSVIRKERRQNGNWIAQSTIFSNVTEAEAESHMVEQTQKQSSEPEQTSMPSKTQITKGQPQTAEEKKRALAEATRAPIPDLEKYLPKPGRINR